MIEKELMKCLNDENLERLLTWYRQKKRDLPWRRTRDPYCIWLSEIMLQQTRVEAVKPYYERFLSVCPTVKTLAECPEEKLLKLWEGLGYYSRVRNLQKAAKAVMTEYDGVIPNEYEKLLTLTGVGEYTAGAIASIAFGQRVPAVDGNVLRVLARLCASHANIAEEATKKAFRKDLAPHVPCEAGDFTQAMIELGATVCGPNGEARCAECPLAAACLARRNSLTGELPVKGAKKPRRIEKKTVFLIREESITVLRRRPPKGLLASLFELPNTEGHLGEQDALDYVRSLGLAPLRILRIDDAKHVFTHVEWHMIAYEVRITPEFDGVRGKQELLLIPNDVLHRDYAIPSAFSAYKKYI